MTLRFPKIGSLLASAAALTLVASPAMARDWRWGRNHDRVDVGDVLTGILIIGGIAAIADAVSKSERDRRERDRNGDYRYPGEAPTADYDPDPDLDTDTGYTAETRPQWAQGRGIDVAVNRCVAEVEEGEARVDQVETVNRSGDGWRITGHMRGGEAFACTADRDGTITDSDVGNVIT